MKRSVKVEIETSEDGRYCSHNCQFNNFNLCANMDWYDPKEGMQQLVLDGNNCVRCDQCIANEIEEE